MCQEVEQRAPSGFALGCLHSLLLALQSDHVITADQWAKGVLVGHTENACYFTG